MTDEVSVTAIKPDREARSRRMAEEGKVARAEYDAATEARDENMARLKALRLEKERAEAEAKAKAPPAPAKRTVKARAK